MNRPPIPPRIPDFGSGLPYLGGERPADLIGDIQFGVNSIGNIELNNGVVVLMAISDIELDRANNTIGCIRLSRVVTPEDHAITWCGDYRIAG